MLKMIVINIKNRKNIAITKLQSNVNIMVFSNYTTRSQY